MSILSKSHWSNAVRLLDFQVGRLQAGTKYFRTLSMSLYRDFLVEHNFVRGPDFFERYIESQIFYGLKQEFRVVDYGIPKGKLGTRNYRMLSVPMRLLHYAYSVYLLDLTQRYLQQTVRRRNSRIHSFYGGDLRLVGEEVKLNPANVWYFDSYKRFSSKLKRSIKSVPGKTKVVLSFDIASFYDRLNVSHLVRALEFRIPASERVRLSFTGRRPLEMIEFYRFLMKGVGIPQSDNDVASDFIAYLYLSLADLDLDDCLFQDFDEGDFEILRYVDDYYLILSFSSDSTHEQRRRRVKKIAERVSDLFLKKWKLGLNDKAKIFDCSNESEFQELTLKIKRVSNPFHFIEVEDDEREAAILTRANSLISELLRITENRPHLDLTDVDQSRQHLKDVFSEKIQEVLKRQDLRDRVAAIFQDIDFDIVKSCPHELTTLLFLYPDIWARYRNYLVNLVDLTSRDSNLLVLAAAQTKFEDQQILNKLASSSGFDAIFRSIRDFRFNLEKLSYFELSENELIKILNCRFLAYQARRRVFAEQSGNWSLAINHLCTELIELYRYVVLSGSPRERGYVKSVEVLDWISQIGCTNRQSDIIRNLFDRRNNNGISHAHLDELNLDDVNFSEYQVFYQAVSDVFKSAIRRMGGSLFLVEI